MLRTKDVPYVYSRDGIFTSQDEFLETYKATTPTITSGCLRILVFPFPSSAIYLSAQPQLIAGLIHPQSGDKIDHGIHFSA